MMSRRVLRTAGLVLFVAFGWVNQTARTEQAPSPRSATIRVHLPYANAQVTVDELPTRQTGADRTFVSPPLEPGRDYTYTIKAVWQPNNYTTITRARKVSVKAGQEIEADLRQADDKHPDKIVIRFVPTPAEIVQEMLKLAEVGKDDVVYDLGCGDGRIVVTAVEKFGAKRGVGVDLDPQRIRESKANAQEHKVEDRVEFRQGDVLEIKDLSTATVVMLYMSDDLNLRLRPILQKTLKPGARVVSHRFTMGDWKPLKTITVTDRDGERYRLHLWKIGESSPDK
ncbi:MAG TPA: TIGR03000 domain-containing protein [Gemmataceae bacterium]|nr:TIGR03000 domain-containing protein [Gemmataceae bacterium]